MKHKNSLRLLILTLIGIIMYSCQKDDEINPQVVEQTPTEGLIKLGEKLENPYSIENMQKALDNLKSSKVSAKSSSVNDIEITTTHLYLRFKPKNEDELNILKADSTFVLYDYPLDYEITENGYFYKDPEVTGDQPTYQYCAIPVDKKLPDGVEHELLANLFIPDEDSDDDTENKIASKSYATDLVDTLVDEALRITNNLDESSTQGKSSLAARRSKWRPAGTIKVWDDVLNRYIGVEGVKVRARRWFTTHTGIANADGYYSCDGRFRRDANYKIDWERYEFALQDGWLNGATYNGPKKRGNWDLNLKDDKQAYYATIFCGAYFYYYKDRMGLKSPPTNSFWKRKLRIKARLENNRSSYVKVRRIWLGADISLQAWGDRSDLVFGTTIHELVHAAHREVDGSAYNSLVWKAYSSPCAPSAESCDHPGPTGASARRVIETWATTVEIVLTNLRYKSYLGNPNYEYGQWRFPSLNNMQRVRISDNNFYTSVGYDLIDDFNQRNEYGTLYPQDRVKGVYY